MRTPETRLRADPGSLWLFDCDGVLLDSNCVKTEAFRAVTSRYGRDVADDVVDHHIRHGGISRYVKFQRIFDELLQRPPESGEFETLLDDYSAATVEQLLEVPVDPAAERLLSQLVGSGAECHVVTGGQQDEVRMVLEQRGLARHFAGIHGSPTPKYDHVARLVGARSGEARIFLVGDSREDLRIALALDLVPVLVTHWSEFADWQQFVRSERSVVVTTDLAHVVQVLSG
jgi:phosphoglycolate phosphatase-like HAD superfamily hydrolase